MPIPSNAGILDKCIKDAGLNPTEDISIEHFLGLTKEKLDKAYDSYYRGDSHYAEAFLQDAANIIEQARIFNKNFGL